MIVRMNKISIKGRKTCLKNVVDALKSTGAFEIANSKQTNKDIEDTKTEHYQNFATQLARTKAVLEFSAFSERTYALSIKQKTPPNTVTITPQTVIPDGGIIEYNGLKSIAAQEDSILALIESIEDLCTEYYETKAAITSNTASIDELKPYTNLNSDFGTLQDTESAFVLTGLIPTEQLEKFKSDVDFENFVFEEFPSTSGKSCVVFVGLKNEEMLIHSIYDYGFERCKLNINTTAAAKIQELKNLIKTLEEKNLEALKKSHLSKQNTDLLKLYYDYINNELDTETLVCSVLQTDNFFILNGWVAENTLKQVTQILKDVDTNIQIKVGHATRHDTPPVLIKSPRIIKPYESITNLYGEPGMNDIDPNPFVAFFYFLFFGLMIGDVGYGLVMILATSFILLRSKPKGGAKDLIAIVLMGGVSAIIWGVFFGSVFGASTSEGILASFLPDGMLNPIDDALLFLGLSLGIGVLHVMFGLVLKFYNLLRQGKVIDAICDALFRVMLFVGAALFALAMFVEEFSALSDTGLLIAVSSVALIVLTAGRKNKGIIGKATGGFGGLYSLVNYMSDILSYARLFGLGLVGAVIAMVANLMGGMLIQIPVVGLPLGLLVAAFFHVFNLAIGLLSAYVHNARLQFIEFFGKFYEGGGKPFVPLASNLKYVRIRSVLK